MRVGLFLSREDGAVSKVLDVDGLARSYQHLTACHVVDRRFRAVIHKVLSMQSCGNPHRVEQLLHLASDRFVMAVEGIAGTALTSCLSVACSG